MKPVVLSVARPVSAPKTIVLRVKTDAANATFRNILLDMTDAQAKALHADLGQALRAPKGAAR